MKQWRGWLVGLALGAGAVGCATVPVKRPVEPSTIVIRNASGQDFQRASVTGLSAPGKAGRRLGSMAPVPRGASQLVVRPATAPPLPAECEISWIDRRGHIFTADIFLKEVLQYATGQPSEALVFEIQPGDQVRVFLEHSR